MFKMTLYLLNITHATTLSEPLKEKQGHMITKFPLYLKID